MRVWQHIKTVVKRVIWFILDVQAHLVFSTDKGFGVFKGKFASFDEARQNAPKNKNKAWSDQDGEAFYRDFINRKFGYKILAYEYTIFYHLNNILRLNPKAKIFDFGGGFGEHFLRYKHHSKQSPLWSVYDREQKMRFQNDIISRFQTETLTFTNQMEGDYDILISCGAIHYLEHYQSCMSKLLKANMGGGGQTYFTPTCAHTTKNDNLCNLAKYR